MIQKIKKYGKSMVFSGSFLDGGANTELVTFPQTTPFS